MKAKINSILGGLTMLLLLLAISVSTGCSKKQIDTTKLDYSFQMADPSVQTPVTEAIEAIDKGDYSVALGKLKTVSADPKLTAEQKTNVQEVIQNLKKR